MIPNYKKLIELHQAALQRQATVKSKQWWERYMKGVIPFRGVGIPKNRELLDSWRKENGIYKWPLESQLELALKFFNEPVAEDKLAGVLFLQNYLYDKLPWKVMVGKYEELFANGLIFDWNICDWFCVRVLGPTIKANGMPSAKAITSWKGAENLWQARSSVVAFVNLASETEYYPSVFEASAVLIRRHERFAKTAVGWVLHDISKYNKGAVLSFIDEYLEFFTKESLSNGLKYFDKGIQVKYKNLSS